MAHIQITGDSVLVRGTDRALTYHPTRVILDDGTWVAHHTRGGSLRSVWAKDLGKVLVQVLHLGDGPSGGELVLSVPEANLLAVGSLYMPGQPTLVNRSWLHAIDQVLAMTTPETRIIAATAEISRDQLEVFRAKLAKLLDLPAA